MSNVSVPGMESKIPADPTQAVEAMDALGVNAYVRPQHPRLNPDTPYTGLPSPNDYWGGYFSSNQRHTVNQLVGLDPTRHAPAVMAQRNKLHELKYKKGSKGKTVKHKATHEPVLTPVHEYVLGEKLITTNIVAARRRREGYTTEELANETIVEFGEMLQDFAKQGTKTPSNKFEWSKAIRNPWQNGAKQLSLFAGGDIAKVQFEWIDENDRTLNPLSLLNEIEIGSMSITEQTVQGPLTTEYRLFDYFEYNTDIDDWEKKRTIDRQIWLNDPNFTTPVFPSTPVPLDDPTRGETDILLANIIENIRQRDSIAELGYATVDNIEAKSVMEFISKSIN